MNNLPSGKNQTLARKENQKLIIDLFKTRDLSTSEVANLLTLSNSGTKKIIDELIASNILVESTPIRTSATGRLPVTLSLNANYGIIAIINFFDREILIADMKNSILYTYHIEVGDKVQDADMHYYANLLKSIINKPRFSRFKLLAIGIIVLGKFDTVTYKPLISYMFSDITINMKNFFFENFHCPVTLKNNLHFAIIAEQEYGCLKNLSNTTNSCYLNIGEGITASYLINGRLYYGSHGYAGEIGFNIINYDDVQSSLADNSDMRTILQNISMEIETTTLPHNFSKSDVKKAYIDNDATVCKIISKAARYIAIAIKNLCDILDFETIVLNGSLLSFGDKFISEIKATLSQFQNITVKLVKTKLGTDATRLGAMELTRNLVFETFINKPTF